MRSPKRYKSLALYLSLSMLSISCLALQEDTQQPIRIVADSAVRDEKQGLTTYTGNVKMNQGSMSISAQSITIHSEGEGVNTIIAQGTPALFRQKQTRLSTASMTIIPANKTALSNQHTLIVYSGSRIEAQAMRTDLRLFHRGRTTRVA